MNITPSTHTIGFIGLGVMGRSMALNLIKAGFTLQVYTRTATSAKDVLAAGAHWCSTPQEVAQKSQVIITIVGYPKDVEDLYLGSGELLATAAPGSFLVDMTTSSPVLAKQIYEAAKARGLQVLDAPVSGGDVGAQEARLSIMVGGEKPAFEALSPVFGAMGKNIVLQGPAGSGQYTKMANQIAIASTMLGVCEALAYGQKAGLNLSTMLESIGSGAAGSWSLTNLGPRIIADNFEPGFFVKHFIKDMRIALDSALELGIETPGLAQSLAMYEKLAALGHENDGTQALFRLYKN